MSKLSTCALCHSQPRTDLCEKHQQEINCHFQGQEILSVCRSCIISIIQDINRLQEVLPSPITLLGDDQALLSPFQRGNNIVLSALP